MENLPNAADSLFIGNDTGSALRIACPKASAPSLLFVSSAPVRFWPENTKIQLELGDQEGDWILSFDYLVQPEMFPNAQIFVVGANDGQAVRGLRESFSRAADRGTLLVYSEGLSLRENFPFDPATLDHVRSQCPALAIPSSARTATAPVPFTPSIPSEPNSGAAPNLADGTAGDLDCSSPTVKQMVRDAVDQKLITDGKTPDAALVTRIIDLSKATSAFSKAVLAKAAPTLPQHGAGLTVCEVADVQFMLPMYITFLLHNPINGHLGGIVFNYGEAPSDFIYIGERFF